MKSLLQLGIKSLLALLVPILFSHTMVCYGADNHRQYHVGPDGGSFMAQVAGALTGGNYGTCTSPSFTTPSTKCLMSSDLPRPASNPAPSTWTATVTILPNSLAEGPRQLWFSVYTNDGTTIYFEFNQDARSPSDPTSGVGVGYGMATNTGVGRTPTLTAVGDFNRDGRLDLVCANYWSNNVSVLLGNPDATFQLGGSYATGSHPWGVAVGDFNRDGSQDIVVTNYGDSTITIRFGDGNGNFDTKPAATYTVDLNPTSVVAADFNRDGKLDLAVANSSAYSISIWLGNGNGTFRAGTNPPVNAFQLAVGDFRGNGKTDIAFIGSGVGILLSKGDGSFDPPVYYSAGAYPRSVAVGDFDGDGRGDLAVANQNSSDVSILLNNGNGTFKAAVPYAVGKDPQWVAIRDLNGDGILDLTVTNYNSNTISILLGNANGAFRFGADYSTGPNPIAVEMGDFNRDGKPDIVVTNNGNNSVSILLNIISY